MPWPRCSISRLPGSHSTRRQREWSRTHCRRCATRTETTRPRSWTLWSAGWRCFRGIARRRSPSFGRHSGFGRSRRARRRWRARHRHRRHRVPPTGRPASCQNLVRFRGSACRRVRAYTYRRAASELTLPSSSVPEQTSPARVVASRDRDFPGRGAMEARRAADRRRAGPDRRGLVALGLLVWAVGEPRPSAPEPWTAPCRCSRCPTDAPPSPPVATPRVTTESVVAPVAANPPVADSAPQAGRSARRWNRRFGSETSDDARRISAAAARTANGQDPVLDQALGGNHRRRQNARRESTHQGAFDSGRSPSDQNPERHLSGLRKRARHQGRKHRLDLLFVQGAVDCALRAAGGSGHSSQRVQDSCLAMISGMTSCN